RHTRCLSDWSSDVCSSDLLSLPRPSIEYRIGERLAKSFPEKAIIEGEEGGFDVEAYARAGQCLLRQQTFLHNQLVTYWISPGPRSEERRVGKECRSRW